jgi:integrase
MLRFTSPEIRKADGKPQVRDMGLGSIYLPSIGLMAGLSPDMARTKAGELRQMVSSGVDPIEQEKRKRAAREQTQTFRFCAEGMIEDNPADWTARVIYGNRGLLKNYIYPIIGDELIRDHLPADVLRVVQPMWRTMNPRARAALSVMSRVYRWARAKGYRDVNTINPTRWEYLADALPPAQRVHQVTHFTPMDYRLVPSFMAVLREFPHVPAFALRMAIFTGCRIGEAVGMAFAELDLDGDIDALAAMPWLKIEELDLDPDHNIPVWAIPPVRHKTGRETGLPIIRPLGPVSLEILKQRKLLQSAPRRSKPRPQYDKAMAELKTRQDLDTVNIYTLAAQIGCNWGTVKRARNELIAARNGSAQAEPSPFVFPGVKHGGGDGPIDQSAVEAILNRVIRPKYPEFGKFDTHGFRTSAANWARVNGYPEELRKMMRGHVVGNEVQRTYERGQLLKARLEMQEAWENYCEGGTKGNVTGLSAARQRRAG